LTVVERRELPGTGQLRTRGAGERARGILLLPRQPLLLSRGEPDPGPGGGDRLPSRLAAGRWPHPSHASGPRSLSGTAGLGPVRLDLSWAEYYGIPFREPPDHDLDFRLLVRAAVAAKRLGAAARYGARLCAAVYASQAWPVDEAVCVRLADEVGLPRMDFSAMLSDAGTEREMDAAAREAHARGAFGVPTFFVRDRMFWGNDRLVLVRHYLHLAARP